MMTHADVEAVRPQDVAPRVLLFGYVNTNVIDGSAFFMAGAASVLSASGACHVTLVTAVPLVRHHVLAEALVNPYVDVVDPYQDASVGRDAAWSKGRRMSHRESAEVLAGYWERGEHDLILVRGTEVADELVALCPEAAPHLLVYVTGVTFADRPVPPAIASAVARLSDANATLLAQTPEMREGILALLDGAGSTPANDVELMSPAVPGGDAAPLPDLGGLRLAYSGKFSPAWRTLEILAGVLEARERYGDVSISVAGDYFKADASVPRFEDEARWLLGRDGVDWLGGVSRMQARREATKAHVGIGWRSPELDTSLELSTKVLELGILGRPTILNPTPMHRAIFGDDYPLYAESMQDFVELIGSLRRSPALLEDARSRMLSVSREHSYDRVLARLLPVILRVSRSPSGDPERHAFMLRATSELGNGPSDSYSEGSLSLSRISAMEPIAQLARLSSSAEAIASLAIVGPYFFADSSEPGREVDVAPGVLRLIAHRMRLDVGGYQSRALPDELDAEIGLAFDATGRAAMIAVRHPLESESVAGVSMSVPQLRARVAELERKHASLLKDFQTLKSSHARLRSSRLMKIQVRYWKAVNRLRSRAK